MMLTVRPSRRRTLGSAIALALACLWIGGPLHAHESIIPGWHDARPNGCPHKSEQGPCALCRLARDISSLTAPEPQRVATLELSAAVPVTAYTAEPIIPARSSDAPRGPPCLLLPPVTA